MANNKATIAKAFKGFEKQILDVTRQELNKWCWQIVEAAVMARENNPRAHDFTGNLLNSIVVCLYEKGEPYAPYFASDVPGVTPAIRRKMLIRPSKLGYTARMYRFKSDYQGTKSAYVPTIDTDGGLGREDAERFFAQYRPEGRNMFDIVVAYTTEYADWVEHERQTTGILQARKFTLRTGMRFLKIGDR